MGNKDKINQLNDIFNLADEVLADIDLDKNSETPEHIDPLKSEDRDKIENERSLSVSEERTPEPIEVIDSELDEYDIISIRTLRKDYNYIKESVIENVELGKKLLRKAMEDIEGDYDINPDIIEAISSLIKANNTSLKDLSKIFKEIKEIENLKRKSLNPNFNNGSETKNFIFTGNLQSLLEKM